MQFKLTKINWASDVLICEFHSIEYRGLHWSLLQVAVATRQQAITLVSLDPLQPCHKMSLGHNGGLIEIIFDLLIMFGDIKHFEVPFCDRTYIFYVVNIMDADVLVTQRAKVSTVVVFTVEYEWLSPQAKA